MGSASRHGSVRAGPTPSTTVVGPRHEARSVIKGILRFADIELSRPPTVIGLGKTAARDEPIVRLLSFIVSASRAA
jgi:hypothetical protein